ncbi:Arylamine N-acetyltransferase pineal gland isozyme NAT-10 [Dissostichus eleginoides]|uniref:arylamine N-acetyltransferase n=1 Tax=Dissostichus eleginoides TaxID=100907 RepID=A0AAD9BX73_DISEL|nr:Arylamine N-acetyltransferase pineal gland isozyme NAT-10 [Dissostichus eleginoides]
MNLQEYFKRIGLQGSFDKPDLETLKLIHKQHVMSVPFENLSMHCGERHILDLEFTFNKIVRSGRGGWCLENNSLFGWVLREMGYNTTRLSSRVFNSSTNEFSPIDSHLIHKVVVDGKAYIADVAFGVSFQIWEPMELVSGKDQHQAAGVFRFIDKGENDRIQSASGLDLQRGHLQTRGRCRYLRPENIEAEEKEQVLLEKFNIKLQNELQIVSNKTWYTL